MKTAHFIERKEKVFSKKYNLLSSLTTSPQRINEEEHKSIDVCVLMPFFTKEIEISNFVSDFSSLRFCSLCNS